jgi:hypothetical protein
MKDILLAILFFIVGLTGCNSPDDISTDTVSTIFKSNPEKINFMEKYYSPKFPYEDVEYHIIYHDNGADRGVPGPSDWTMYFAFKLDTTEIKKRSAFDQSKRIDIDNWIKFLPKNKKWNLDYPKQYAANSILIKENNILLLKVSTGATVE